MSRIGIWVVMEETEINNVISLALAGNKCNKDNNRDSSVRMQIHSQVKLNHLKTNSKTIQKKLHLMFLQNNLQHRGDLAQVKRIP